MNTRVTYCGTREDYDSDERVLVERGESASPLLCRDVIVGQFGWGYAGSATLELAASILLDFLEVPVGKEEGHWVCRRYAEHAVADQFLVDAGHLWLITGATLKDFLGAWAERELSDERTKRHVNGGLHGSTPAELAERMEMRDFVPRHGFFTLRS
jgi:hypothetical protein